MRFGEEQCLVSSVSDILIRTFKTQRKGLRGGLSVLASALKGRDRHREREAETDKHRHRQREMPYVSRGEAWER